MDPFDPTKRFIDMMAPVVPGTDNKIILTNNLNAINVIISTSTIFDDVEELEEYVKIWKFKIDVAAAAANTKTAARAAIVDPASQPVIILQDIKHLNSFMEEFSKQHTEAIDLKEFITMLEPLNKNTILIDFLSIRTSPRTDPPIAAYPSTKFFSWNNSNGGKSRLSLPKLKPDNDGDGKPPHYNNTLVHNLTILINGYLKYNTYESSPKFPQFFVKTKFNEIKESLKNALIYFVLTFESLKIYSVTDIVQAYPDLDLDTACVNYIMGGKPEIRQFNGEFYRPQLPSQLLAQGSILTLYKDAKKFLKANNVFDWNPEGRLLNVYTNATEVQNIPFNIPIPTPAAMAPPAPA